jgi:putative lipoprotein
MRASAILVGVVALVQLGCAKPPETTADSAMSPTPPPAAPAAMQPITDRDWELVSLGEVAAPKGAGGRPATLRLDAAQTRAAGFSGCNRYTGPYTLTADSLTFGALVSTKMFCQDGDSLERSYLAMLANARTFTATDTTLTLGAAGAPLATFHAR